MQSVHLRLSRRRGPGAHALLRGRLVDIAPPLGRSTGSRPCGPGRAWCSIATASCGPASSSREHRCPRCAAPGASVPSTIGNGCCGGAASAPTAGSPPPTPGRTPPPWSARTPTGTGRRPGASPAPAIACFAARRGLARPAARRASPRAGPVLDVGAGEGTLLDALRARGREAIGLERASTRADVRALDLDELDERFGAIVFWHSLEHLPDAEPRPATRGGAAAPRRGAGDRGAQRRQPAGQGLRRRLACPGPAPPPGAPTRRRRCSRAWPRSGCGSSA